ncbi:MAG: hypothetical protein IPK97_14945 [Ahniella sp.]|nr:hypothetical protein [Ahniella sp.]
MFFLYSVIAFAIVCVFLFGVGIFQWLWNITLPRAVSSANTIDYWVAFRLVLIGLLISSPITVRIGG